MPLEEAEAFMMRFPTHSMVSFSGELTHAGYKVVPVSYLVCEGDLVISKKAQMGMVEMIERESGKKVDITMSKASHGINVSAPQDVVNWVAHMTKLGEE
jgi:hypothetical protein